MLKYKLQAGYSSVKKPFFNMFNRMLIFFGMKIIAKEKF